MEKVKLNREVPKNPNQRKIMSLYPERKALRKSLSPSYYPIKHHIYYDGSSFRVRVMSNGEKVSRNLTDKKEAIKLRDFLLLNKKLKANYKKNPLVF